MQRCNTSAKAKFHCRQVVTHFMPYFAGRNQNQSDIPILFLMQGTYPMADIFWFCQDEDLLKIELPPVWKGICTPVMVTGQITVLSQNDIVSRKCNARSLTFYMEDKVYITRNQEPHGVPSEHRAIGEDWIISGQLAGSVPLVRQ